MKKGRAFIGARGASVHLRRAWIDVLGKEKKLKPFVPARRKRALSKLSFLPVAAPPPPIEIVAKPAKVKLPKQKNDPKHVAAARELRDRYLEQFNSGLVLPGGKYEVTRALPAEKPAPLALPDAA